MDLRVVPLSRVSSWSLHSLSEDEAAIAEFPLTDLTDLRADLTDEDVLNENTKETQADSPDVPSQVPSTKIEPKKPLSEDEEKALAAKLRRADNAACKAFKLFDINGDGTLAVSELGNLANALGKNLSKEVIAKIIDQCDTDDDSTLTLEEFKNLFHRFNEERLAEHQKQSLLTRQHLSSRDVAVAPLTRCRHMCVGAAKTACCVPDKLLLLLLSVTITVMLIPALGSAYRAELTENNNYTLAVLWCTHWVFYPAWTIICYYFAFPRRQPIWLLAILASIYAVLGFLNVAGLACPLGFFWSTFTTPATGSFEYKVWRSTMTSFQATVNLVLLFLYRGPVRFKCLFGATVFLMLMLPVPPLNTFWTGSSSVNALTVVFIIVAVISVIRVNDCMHRRRGGKRIGGSRAYTAMLALMLPNVVPGFSILMYYIFRFLADSPTLQIIFYLIFTMCKLQMRDAIAIAASSSLPDDVTTVVFMFYPIFAFQYFTELMFLSVGHHFSAQFIIFIMLKLTMGTMTKGGFLIHWTTSLKSWVRRKRKRHGTRKSLLRGVTHAANKKLRGSSTAKLFNAAGPLKRPLQNGSFPAKPKRTFIQSTRRDVSCRQAELNCLYLIQHFIDFVFSFLSNTSGQTLHEIKGMSDHQRMVQSTVVTFTLISMSNLSSLACNLGSMAVLIVEHMLPPSHRVWFIGVKDGEWWTTHLAFGVVLVVNLFILFVSSWTKFARWTKLQVLFKMPRVTQHSLIQAKNKQVRKAKAKFLLRLHRKRVGHRTASDRNVVDSAHGHSRASTEEILLNAESHGNKLYMLEREVFRKHIWILLMVTVHVTLLCSLYGVEEAFVSYMASAGVTNCNWTLVYNNTELPPPGKYGWPNFTFMCGSSALPNLNCSFCHPDGVPEPNCTLY